MVELLLLLLFVSLITAALTPVVTRKHFKIPKPTNHGAYACYYRLIFDGSGKITGKKLHESRFSGKALNTVIFDRDVERCTFEPPQKVSYFHVSAIGGGGGGGDSGYNGGAYNTLGPYTEQLSPLGITKEMLNARDITEEDLRRWGGKLYGYVHGATSGSGGDQNYVTRNDGYPCTQSHPVTTTETYTYTRTSCKKDQWVEDCDKAGGCGTSNSNGTGSTSPPEPGPPVDTSCRTVCDPGPTERRCIKPRTSCSSSTQTGCLVNGSFIAGGSSAGECGHNGGGIPWSQEGPEVCVDAGCDEWQDFETQKCREVCDTTSYNIQDKKLKIPNLKYHNPNTQFAMLHPKYTFLFSNKINENLLAGGWHCLEWNDPVVTTSTTTHHTDVCDRHQNYYTYGKDTYTGGAGAAGAICRTPYKDGQLGLTLTGDNIPAGGANGKSCMNAQSHSSEYDYATIPNGYCIACPATNGKTVPGGSTITFGGSTVTAQNAISAGTAATCNSNGTAGTNGSTCSGGSTVSEGCSPDRYGYCLQRHSRSTWESGATYEFKFTFSQNYLQYGEAGTQGQYRTMIIRSFKQDNIPITLGIGGQKGENGGTGGVGTETVFGDIMRAKGGTGGQGGFLTPPEVLTGYIAGAEGWPAGTINAAFTPGRRIVRQEGGKDPEKPKPDNLSSNILNFLVPQDNERITSIIDDNLVGYGGKGGGSQHDCWFGEYKKWIDQYSGAGELEHSYAAPPTSCTNNFKRIEALPGRDGALIIRW